ncbi:hypothetical protein NW766_009584 [Fusarium irregulare]|uniref:Uncharacterized protein n=1 Tax=Fusarium irregulare TaxID=2494466 RepID=A0A9W8PII0_9HYPO|nr:hypothetical protein NW766_009584 [Fusarium irregulare]
MQASLYKIFATTAAFSTVLSAPEDPADGQLNATETIDLHVEATPVKVAEVKETDDGDVQKCPRDTAPDISTREKHGQIFERS